eukprot:CAMPEP_0173195500 /NCGR_PEP_ID=MMETSP1141-20130122/15092_1 /TAXON_ID=483371 /ORGANISM="non described non described, Strain CCMP2298" /LENGTH=113 /DNA_ID=CAMNT_0014120041 /DNA_START=377 /DNA_END=718 /DNA_ORIENTATION=-
MGATGAVGAASACVTVRPVPLPFPIPLPMVVMVSVISGVVSGTLAVIVRTAVALLRPRALLAVCGHVRGGCHGAAVIAVAVAVIAVVAVVAVVVVMSMSLPLRRPVLRGATAR